MLLQVHDELVLEVAPGEREAVEKLVIEQMGSAAELSVPLDVQIGVGPAGTRPGTSLRSFQVPGTGARALLVLRARRSWLGSKVWLI